MPPEPEPTRQSGAEPAALGLLAAGVSVYLAFALAQAGALAFPLDDAWIHQTYARTFAQNGEWAYRPGQPSSGSTAPLWTLLLALGYWLGAPPAWWGYALGVGCTAALILLGGQLSYTLFQNRLLAFWTMLALAAEWHLLWAAVSGMEIPLYTALSLLLLWLWAGGHSRPWLWGLVGGMLTLTRPEGLWLVALVAAGWSWERREQLRSASAGLAQMGLSGLAVVGPLLWFNWQLSAQVFPNTLYAKQQEYASLLALPLWQRLWQLLAPPWIGGQTFLLPGLPFLAWRRWSLRQWLPLVWVAGLVAVYALRLPVTYQHGRYLMPVIPVLVMYGMAGFNTLLARLPRLWVRPLAIGVAAAFGLFVLLGAGSYASDVALIECEMGGAAAWIAQNAPRDALLAIHDIGKVGYETPNPLLDFAGLISPETIPILRDQEALLALALERDAAYLVSFADWYPEMVQDPRLQARFATGCARTAAARHAPMTIFEVNP